MVEKVFTGLIEELGAVQSFKRSDDGAKISIKAPEIVPKLGIGDSVAVDGVCLTCIAVDEESFSVEAMNQTLSNSQVGMAQKGDRVNLELPLRVSDRLGGHFVQGHVDGVGEVLSAELDGFACRVQITASREIICCMARQGSVSVNGVSLTISCLDGKSFGVSLIPETLARTNLGCLKPQDRVNIEVDILAKYVSAFLGERIQGS